MRSIRTAPTFALALAGALALAAPACADATDDLFGAARGGTASEVQAALSAGADPNARNEGGWAPLDLAAEYNDASVVTALIEDGADPNARDEDGWTPLHWAAEYNDASVVTALIEGGADPNARDEDGWTPLHWAAEYNDVSVVTALIEGGADPFAVVKDGRTPLAMASINENPKVYGKILEYHLPQNTDNINTTPPSLLPVRCWFDDESGPMKKCFFMVVSEDPDDATSARIGFPVVKFFTRHPSTKNPVLHLGGGGPGSAMGLGYPSEIWNEYKNLVSRSGRDFYVIDPRGVGMASPRLSCTKFFAPIRKALGKPMTRKEEGERWMEVKRNCKERLDEWDRDLSQYNSRVVARDVELLRHALKIEKWILYGVSYGSRYALTIARDFPDSVEAMILNGAVFPNLRYETSSAEIVALAFDKVFSWCGSSSVCNPQSLRKRFQVLIDNLDDTPYVVDALSPELAAYYGVERFVLTGSRLVQVAFIALYDAEFFPKFATLVSDLERGETKALEDALVYYFSQYLDPGFSHPVNYAHYCAEVYPFADYDEMMRRAWISPLYIRKLYRDYTLEEFRSECRLWNVTAADSVEGAAIATSIPTLFLQGALDPVTPIDYLDEQLRYFDHHALLVFNDSSHLGSVHGTCAMDAAAYFIKHKQLDREHAQCAQ